MMSRDRDTAPTCERGGTVKPSPKPLSARRNQLFDQPVAPSKNVEYTAASRPTVKRSRCPGSRLRVVIEDCGGTVNWSPKRASPSRNQRSNQPPAGFQKVESTLPSVPTANRSI